MLSDRFRAAAEAGDLAAMGELFRADGRDVEGIDKLTFDADGLISELKVMIRPASALGLVGARMAEEFGRLGLGLGLPG